MTTTYVFTTEQFLNALVLGGVESGILPKETAERMCGSLEHVQFELAANGLVLVDNTPSSEDESVIEKPARKPTTLRDVTAAGKARADESDGPDAEKVKAALAVSMERPPSLSTVRSWTAKERKQALKWARHPETERPAHVVPRKPRGSSAAPEAEESEPSSTNGAAEPETKGTKSRAAKAKVESVPPPTPPDEEEAEDDEDDDEDDSSAESFFATGDDE